METADINHTRPSSFPGLLAVQTRAEDAAVGAMCSPLLDFPIDEARGVVFNIVGGPDMSLMEVLYMLVFPFDIYQSSSVVSNTW